MEVATATLKDTEVPEISGMEDNEALADPLRCYVLEMSATSTVSFAGVSRADLLKRVVYPSPATALAVVCCLAKLSHEIEPFSLGRFFLPSPVCLELNERFTTTHQEQRRRSPCLTPARQAS